MTTERQLDIILESELEFKTFKEEPMSNKQLPADVQARICKDALNAASGIGDQYRKDGIYHGYIAGATAEHAHMQPVIDAAEKVAKLFSHTDGNCAICELARAIEQWKGKEPDRPCPHCGKELSRDRNICCRECGKEVGDDA